MRGPRNSMCVQIAKWRRQRRDAIRKATSAPIADTLIIASVIYEREFEGSATTLRELHKLSDLSQPQALNAIAQLDLEGMVVIEHDTQDELASEVTLTNAMRAQAARISRRKAA
ncbi:MAG: hypothetical protein AAF250_01745 [Pseudomonadota bacterium]